MSPQLSRPTRLALLALAALLAFIGLAGRYWGIERSQPVSVSEAVSGGGNAYFIVKLDLPSHLPSDANERPRASSLRLFENGVALGPAHAVHEDIRVSGRGRFSHWQSGLLFAASDNSDPRGNGRSYTVSYPALLPPAVAWCALIAALLLVLLVDSAEILREVRDACASGMAALARMRPSGPVRSFAAAGLLLLLVLVSLWLGFERSAWILITQPADQAAVSNSLLGYTMFRDGTVMHKENLSAFQQVAFFAGADVYPDLYFRRPVYSFLAAVLAPVFGAVASLVLLNLVAWAAAAWLCQRFATRFYGDEEAGRWAGIFAVAGIGFVLHALDLSAHLLAFTFYMAGVVLVHESECWRRRIPLRSHLAIGAFLALACLQYNTGLALVAAYFVVAIRHNSPWAVAAASALALLAQPAWGHVVAALYLFRHGTPLPDMSATEAEYFSRALQAWMAVFRLPAGEMFSRIGHYAGSFLWFEMPLAVLLGALKLILDARTRDGRERAAFALPFVAFPVAAGMVFATAAGARGYLIYGISIFVFAACGAAIAAGARRRARVFVPLGMALGALMLAWSLAHTVNVLGPAKAYFLGMEYGANSFARWEAVSLTGAEPTPRIFGGTASIADAGLSTSLPLLGTPAGQAPVFAVAAGALIAIACAMVLMGFAGLRWRLALAAAAAMLALAALGERSPAVPRGFAYMDRVKAVDRTPLRYEITMAEPVRRRFADGVRAGRAVALYPAAYSGSADPMVTVGTQPVRVSKRYGRFVQAEWLLDHGDLQRALDQPDGARLTITFPAAADAWVGGWQRMGLPGRQLGGVESGVPPALPAVEVRMLRDAGTSSLELVCF